MKLFSIVIKLGISKLIKLHVLLWVNNAFVILFLYFFFMDSINVKLSF
jgi:hypothetical protein